MSLVRLLYRSARSIFSSKLRFRASSLSCALGKRRSAEGVQIFV